LMSSMARANVLLSDVGGTEDVTGLSAA